ncbi:hypothetical protein HOO65_060007 [Ceratocystis lukuohia]|uniref:Retrotransposon gag domain-containing protein n=1 Tax=Ceratocystis lukuohia TaxID=2019550 RepID=A0ABR4MD30_9PEZI
MNQVPENAPQASFMETDPPTEAHTADPKLVDEAVEAHANYLCHIAQLRAAVEAKGQSFAQFDHLLGLPTQRTMGSTSYRPKIEAPTFKGDLKDFPTYYQHLRMKWEVDKEFPNADKEFIATVMNKLEGPVARYATAQVQRLDAANLLSGESFLKMMYTKYHDPTAAGKARHALHQLHQGNKSFDAHLQRFEELLYLSGCDEFTDFQKIELLKSSLSPKIIDVLYYHFAILPKEYNAWVLRVQELWQQMQAVDHHRARHTALASSSRPGPSQRAPPSPQRALLQFSTEYGRR